MTEEEENQLMMDAFENMDAKIGRLKAIIIWAEDAMNKYRAAWSLVQKARARKATK